MPSSPNGAGPGGARAAPPSGDGAAGTPCPNCGAPREGAYCASCGQATKPLRQPVHHFLADAFTEYFGIDGRLWRSLRLLLVRPGALTRAYLEGQRVRYLRPLRLYLSATLAFFFLISLLDPVSELQSYISKGIDLRTTRSDSTTTAASRIASIDSALAAYGGEVAQLDILVDSLAQVPGVEVAYDSLGEVDSIDLNYGELPPESREEVVEAARFYSGSGGRATRRLRWQRDEFVEMAPDSVIRPGDWMIAAELVIPDDFHMSTSLPDWVPRSRPIQRLAQSRTNDERATAIADLTRNVIAHIPTVMFLLLPVFALILKVIYVRRAWFYSEHLVFALHVHAFAFLVFAALAVLLWASGGAGWAATTSVFVGFVGIPLYFFVAQKRVYEQGWIKTTIKAMGLGAMYSFLLFWGLIGAVLLAASF